METTGNKNRTHSRCREWERNRRNKFNDAIARLGEVVKKIDKAKSGSKEPEKEQYPKIEIVEKAIVCLTACLQEKTQLKAEILALQVKIDTENKQRENRKDVSTQVFIGISKKNKSDKYVKVLMLQKSKRKALKKKTLLTINATVDSKVGNNEANVKEATQTSPPKLPTLLPKANVNDKKGPENTIVVLPATPYIFQQRPLILPTVPPAFVLVDQNIQTLNKPSFSIVNRTNNDVTKTTMVNILPISAYSRPLSANKTKRSSKAKSDVNKKTKKAKSIINKKEQKATTVGDVPKTTPLSSESIENKSNINRTNELPQENNISENANTNVAQINTSENSSITKAANNIAPVSAPANSPVSISTTTTEMKICKPVSFVESPKTTSHPKVTKEVTESNTLEKSVARKTGTTPVAENTVDKNKTKTQIHPNEKVPAVDKDKENKMTNILDASLCETGVDGGNARLELAEEFLAASPTAAFLMSFPLVSGNRADSPAEETSGSLPVNSKDSNHRRSEIATQALPYYEKSNHTNMKLNPSEKLHPLSSHTVNKQDLQNKYIENNAVNKSDNIKMNITTTASNVTNENPFLNLSMSSLLPTTCTLSDSTYGLDFDCNISKSMPSQSSSYASNSNIFYKSDPFSTVKSAIYSTSSISSGHEFNSFGLYPCAMEKYTTKNKTDFSNVEENLMKIGSSRLTYDIDLGWSHKGFDFVSCSSTANTFGKDSILTTASGPYSTSYNPFNPDFHVPLVTTSSSKKDSAISKPTTSVSDTITSFYSSQPTNLWTEDVPFYTNNSNIPKSLSSRHQNYLPVENTQTNIKHSDSKQYEPKHIQDTGAENVMKPLHSGSSQQVSEKYKKSPNKMHINWMTSEVRPMQTNCNPVHTDVKHNHKSTYNHIDHVKKQDHSENNYFPISMHNFPAQSVQEELQVWPTARPAGTTEITMEPPPINLPTLVGDLALGPHDKRKTAESSNRGAQQPDIQNCSNFFSVTQLMNRSTDMNVPSRYQVPSIAKQNTSHITSDSNRKTMTHTDSHIHQPCYVFNDQKSINSFETMNQFTQSKVKTNKPEKSSKAQKNSYSAEALLRGGTCNPKIQDNNSAKFMIPSQKYNDFNTPQDSNVAQVSHFPPILDYSDNSYSGQQFSGTNLYNTTTNTISNSFYSNFMPGSSNLMPSNYTSGPFASDFIDYNQTGECSYPNNKYTDLKMRNNPAMFQQEKVSNYKSSRRESAAKHKLECSKKDSKKCQSKRPKLNNESDDWNDASQLLWQNKTPSKRHSNLMSEELPFPNYVGNQVAAGQYQPDFFNSHIMPSNMQPVGHNVDRCLASFPATSRANFNLSTIFPEITMKVQ